MLGVLCPPSLCLGLTGCDFLTRLVRKLPAYLKPCVVEVEPAKLRVPCITAACTMRCHNEHSLGRACTNPHDSLPGCLVCMRVPPSVIAAGRMQRTVGRGPANEVGELEVGGHKRDQVGHTHGVRVQYQSQQQHPQIHSHRSPHVTTAHTLASR